MFGGDFPVEAINADVDEADIKALGDIDDKDENGVDTHVDDVDGILELDEKINVFEASNSSVDTGITCKGFSFSTFCEI